MVHAISFLAAAGTNYHKLNWRKQQKCVILQFYVLEVQQGALSGSMSRCRESCVPLWVFGVKSLSLPLSRDHHTPWLVAPSPSAKPATVRLWASSVVTYPTDHRPESSLLLRARVTQNDLPISRSVTFRTRRPFCHLLQRFEPGHLRGDVLPTTALLQAEYFYDSSALLCVSVVCCSYCRSVSGVWNHHSCMSVLLMGIWVITSVWLLWIKVHSYTYVFCFFYFPWEDT